MINPSSNDSKLHKDLAEKYFSGIGYPMKPINALNASCAIKTEDDFWAQMAYIVRNNQWRKLSRICKKGTYGQRMIKLVNENQSRIQRAITVIEARKRIKDGVPVEEQPKRDQLVSRIKKAINGQEAGPVVPPSGAPTVNVFFPKVPMEDAVYLGALVAAIHGTSIRGTSMEWDGRHASLVAEAARTKYIEMAKKGE